jgi:uncharacterized protein (TIGR03437 family)
VLAPDGASSIDTYSGMVGISDEHQSIFPPQTLQGNNDYLFFVATHTAAGAPSTGLVVLSGGAGPSKNGQWTLGFPSADGYGAYPAGYGQVFVSSTQNCPTVANAANQDQTFDQDYAAPGSVIFDPTAPSGSLLMIYEGTNTCLGSTGGGKNNFYSSVAVATSNDYGHTWPTYRGKTGFNFVQLPAQNANEGPGAPMGATGSGVCMGNNCTITPPASYGRYPVLTPSVSIAAAAATGQPLADSMGDSEMSAFLDDASGNPSPYVYISYNYKNGGGATADPKAPLNDLMIARGQLNGGSSTLTFQKWSGQSFSAPGIAGYDSPVFPAGPFATCQSSSQLRYGSSISYVDATQQYLLLFVCDSAGDPAAGQYPNAARGGAWFYSTSYDLSDPTQWTPPEEVIGSWSEFDTSGGCSDYKGFYPTMMSLGAKPGHLSTTGYIFYLWGCQTDNTPPPGRQYSSRAFSIATAAPSLTAGSLANGATYASGGLVPGSWAQVKGSDLSPTTRIWGSADFQGLGNDLPTNLSGVQVTLNNLPAAVYYIDPEQISFQVPSGVAGNATVQVINNGVASNTIAASAAASAPGIFPVVVNGVNYPAGVFPDGKYVGDPTVNPAFRAARPGDVIQLFATGLVPVPAGVLPTPQIVSGVTVTVGTTTVPASYAGLVAVGEFQINFTVPPLSNGVYPISIAVDGVSSPAQIDSNPPGPLVVPIQQ